MTPLIWAVLLLLVSLVLLILEMFVPSGGTLGILAAASAIFSITLVFWHEGAMLGTLFLAFVVMMLPILGTAFVRWWPKTPIGRRILNIAPLDEQTGIGDRFDWRDELIGQRGVARTKMLPSGSIEVGGKVLDAVSNGVPVDAGEGVEVVAVRSNALVVRPLALDRKAEEEPHERTTVTVEDAEIPPAVDPFADPLA